MTEPLIANNLKAELNVALEDDDTEAYAMTRRVKAGSFCGGCGGGGCQVHSTGA